MAAKAQNVSLIRYLSSYSATDIAGGCILGNLMGDDTARISQMTGFLRDERQRPISGALKQRVRNAAFAVSKFLPKDM